MNQGQLPAASTPHVHMALTRWGRACLQLRPHPSRAWRYIEHVLSQWRQQRHFDGGTVSTFIGVYYFYRFV